jgi:hypothetical protein
MIEPNRAFQRIGHKAAPRRPVVGRRMINKGGKMRTIGILFLVSVIAISTVSLVCAAGLSDEMARNAYKQILSEADKNKDGKLSLAECKAIFKDKAKAEKNCGFWDVNHDGVIMEDEYVGQVLSLRKKK